MTSKRSFLKLIFENIKRHAAIVYFTLLAFILHVLATFINIQNIMSTERLHEVTSSFYPLQAQQEAIANIKEQIADVFEPKLFYGIFAFLLGIIIAYDFLRNLHSKKQTDFYESLPISRQKRFGITVFSGISLFSIPLIVSTALNLLIVCATGFMTKTALYFTLWSLLCNFLSFLLGFTTAAFVMILTGHVIVAALGFGIICAYVPLIIAFLFPTYAGTFFQNFIWDTYNNTYFYFSPATLLYKMTYNWRTWTILEHWKYIVGSACFVSLAGLISYFLFMKRPAETAGRAMAFEKKNYIVRFMIVIPISLYAGQLMYHIVSVGAIGKIIWMIFGILFGAFILHCIMESIFQFDIKAAFHQKKHLFISVGFSLLFLSVFAFDVFGYDKFIPKPDGLKTIHISTYLGNNSWDQNIEGDGIKGKHIAPTIEAITELQKLIEEYDYSDDQQHKFYNNFDVTYVYKNGMKTKRSYKYIGDEFPKSLEKIFTTEEYKNDICILYQKDRYDISSVEISNSAQNRSFTKHSYNIDEFYRIYLKEYTNATLYQFLTEDMVYEIHCNVNATNSFGQNYTMKHRYPVYRSFKETIAFIENMGIPSFVNSPEIKLQKLELYGGKYAVENQKYIDDEKKLEELRPYLIPGAFVNDCVDDYIYCELDYLLNDNVQSTTVYIPNSDFLKIYGQ